MADKVQGHHEKHNPNSVRRAPIADVVTVGNALPGREIGMLVRAASSV